MLYVGTHLNAYTRVSMLTALIVLLAFVFLTAWSRHVPENTVMIRNTQPN